MYVRPTEKGKLAPFDQSSQRPLFPAGTDTGSPEEFLEWARGRSHPANRPPPPLAEDLQCAIEYVWRCGSSIAGERRRRMGVIAEVSRRLEPLSTRLCDYMCQDAVIIARAMQLNILQRTVPNATMADVGEDSYCPHFGLWCAMLDALDWPHRELVACLLRGFRSVGDIPDSGLWRAVDRPARMPFGEFSRTNAAWVYQCRAKVVTQATNEPNMAAACWVRTIEERDAGLIQGPFTINQVSANSGVYPAYGFGMYRPAPRFAIEQGEKDDGTVKIRCIDNMATNDTNEGGTSVRETPICDRPDSPLLIGCEFHRLGPPPHEQFLAVLMGGGCEDYFAAYRRIVTANGQFTVIMVWDPVSRAAVLFRVPGHNFGLQSAVNNFYCVPEPVVRFARRILAVPVTRFYDDHQISEPSYAGGSGQDVYFDLHEHLRFHFDLKKRMVWARKFVYTGVLTDWECDNMFVDTNISGFVRVGVARKRRTKVLALILRMVERDNLSCSDAAMLRGKTRYCLCPVFGRVGVAVVSLLRERQLDPSRTDIDAELSDALELLAIAVDLLPDFVVPLCRGIRPPIVVLTDASFATGHTWLGFVVCCPWNGMRWAGMETPAWVLQLLRRYKQRDTEIGPLETIVADAPYLSLPESWFRNRAISHYIDNQGAAYSLIHGRSKDRDINRSVFVTLMHLSRMSCSVWFDYVPSASNIADLPTRLDADAFSRLNKLGPRVPMRLQPEWCLSCRNSDLKSLFPESS